jgi:putative ABC transport system permease protein
MLLLVLTQSMRVVIVGMGLGLLVAGLAAGLLGTQIANLLVSVNPMDPLTFGGTVFILLVVAVLACVMPARRAARIDPLLALRQD